MFLFGLLVGLFVGAPLGFILCALLTAGKRANQAMGIDQ